MSDGTRNNVEAQPRRYVEFTVRLRCRADCQPSPDERLKALLKRTWRNDGLQCLSVQKTTEGAT